MHPTPTENWLVFEDDEGEAGEYADFDQQVELSAADAADHHEYVKRLGDEYGFPLPEWTPTIPSRSHQ